MSVQTLQALLRGLQEYDFESLSGENVEQRSNRLDKVREDANQLAREAREMTTRGDQRNMTVHDRRVYNALAATLHNQTSALVRQMEDPEPGELRKQIDQITRTCNECHARFRPVGMAMKTP